VLGVDRWATHDQIRQRWHELARTEHPDHAQADGPVAVAAAEERMKEINAAWAALGDVESRNHVDARLRYRATAPYGGRPAPWTSPPSEARARPAPPPPSRRPPPERSRGRAAMRVAGLVAAVLVCPPIGLLIAQWSSDRWSSSRAAAVVAVSIGLSLLYPRLIRLAPILVSWALW
jgi:curved DNA-binding protein CbpA